jgi:hypothetical protein
MESSSGLFRLEWDPPVELSGTDRPAHYIVYRCDTSAFDISRSEFVVALLPAEQNFFVDHLDRPTSTHYYYVVTAVNSNSVESRRSNEAGAEIKEAVVIRQRILLKTVLAQNSPNPFEKRTFLSYQLASQSRVTLTVYDQSGSQIDKLVDSMQEPGNYTFPLFTFRLSKGVYRYTLTTEADSLSKYFTIR